MLHTNTRTGASLPRRRFSPYNVSLNLGVTPQKSSREVVMPGKTKPVATPNFAAPAGNWRVVVNTAGPTMRLILVTSPH
jgi:hypothetical protein